MQENYILQNNESVIVEIKKSKFIGYSFVVENLAEVENYLTNVKTKHNDATHVCYAYVTSGHEKCFDDGEPSKTAGKPILDCIKKQKLQNVLIVVVRYFGGIKLGSGGLIRAYSNCASLVIKKSNKIEFVNYKTLTIKFDYGKEEKQVLSYLKNNNIEIIFKQYNQLCTLKIKIDELKYDLIVENLKAILKQDII